MKLGKLQCDTCNHCLSIDREKGIVDCTCRELALIVDNAEAYDERKEETGAGYCHTGFPFCSFCGYYSDAPSLPEPKLIHSLTNWEQYRKVKE